MVNIKIPHLYCLLAVCLLVQPIRLSVAQQTNMALFQQMAVECLGPVPSAHRQFHLEASGNKIPFIQSGLIQYWQENEYTVFLADSTQNNNSASFPTLTYSIEKINSLLRTTSQKAS